MIARYDCKTSRGQIKKIANLRFNNSYRMVKRDGEPEYLKIKKKKENGIERCDLKCMMV